MPPEELTFNVVPSGAGDILFDGTAFSSYPTTEMIEVGSHNLQAEPLPWWAFTHWTLDGNVVTPDETSSLVQLDVFEPGVVTAHFEAIPHTNLTVLVSPPEAGQVRVWDLALVDDVLEHGISAKWASPRSMRCPSKSGSSAIGRFPTQSLSPQSAPTPCL